MSANGNDKLAMAILMGKPGAKTPGRLLGKPDAREDAGMTAAPGSDEGPDEVGMGYQTAAEEMLEAYRAGDSKAMAARLKDFVRMCLAEYEKDG